MELLERSDLLADLERLVESARRGSGAIVAIGGEAGIGKTSVVEVLRSRVTRARFLVGACDSLTTPRPLGPLHDIAVDPASGMARPLSDGRARHEVFDAFLDELRSSLRPAVVVFEDVHWADEATLDLIRFVGRRVTDTHGVVVITYRDDEVGPLHPLTAVLGDLATARGLRRFTLQPLSEEAVAAMAEGTGADPETVFRVTGGNPFFAAEVLAAGGVELPATVAAAVLARVARLGQPARRLLNATSIVPGRVPGWLVERLVGDDVAARGELVDRGVLVPSVDGLEFRHELARLAVEGALDADVRARLHRKALAALEAAPPGEADAARLAHHAERAGDAAATVHWGRRAAEAALAAGSYAEALAHDMRTLRTGALDGSERAEVLERLATTARHVDRTSEGLDALVEAADIWRRASEPEREARVLADLAFLQWLAGSGADAIATISDALDLAGRMDPGPGTARVHMIAAYLAMLGRRVDDAIELGMRAVVLGERFGEHAVVIQALNAVGSAKITGGRAGGTADLERSVALAEAAGDIALRQPAISNLGSALGEARRYREALPHLEASIRYGEQYDLDLSADYGTAWLARVHFEQGRWGPAVLLAERSMRRETASPLIRIVALTVLGRVVTRRGEPGAQGPLEGAHRLAAVTGDLQRTWPVAAGLAERAWLRRQPADRIQGWVTSDYERSVHLGVPWAKGELAYWMWRAGALTRPPPGCPEPVSLQIAGDWRGAAEAWRAIGCPYEEADALADGDDEARLAALRMFDDLGAAPAAARLRSELRARGVAVPRGPRATTAAHPAGLTRRQAEVLALLAEGLSNVAIAERLFISPKTVDHHVSAILAKLGVSSRGEAAAEAHRVGLAAATTRE
jgi:DNA-binding CsgD family transcriptional regulator